MVPPILDFRSDLQGLRAIAVVLVVLAHSGLPLFQGGFIGVDVFFVLSGYLITGLLFREFVDTGQINFVSFYARRLKRLLPALVFMLLISSAAAIFFLSAVEARSQLASSPFAASWTSNFYFAFTTVDYFDELTSKDLFLHTWSLGVEEQFYIIWPMVLLVLLRFMGFSTSSENTSFKGLFIGLGIVLMASFLVSLYWMESQHQLAFYLMPSRIWQFALGAMVSVFFQSSSKNIIAKSGIAKQFDFMMLGMGLLLIIGSSVVLRPEISYPGYWAILPSVGTALVLLASIALSNGSNNPLAHPVLVWIGDRSYSLYLWHWPIFMLAFSMGGKGDARATLVMWLISLLAAIISYRFIELPFWKGRWSRAASPRILLLSLFMMVSMVFVVNYGQRSLPSTSTTADISNQWRMDVPLIYKIPCDAWYANAKVQPCMFGVEGAKKTVVLFGDSVGAQWFSMVPEIYPAPEWRTIVFTKSSCAMVDEDYYYPRIGKIYQVCTDWRNGVLAEIKVIKPDVVIMGSAATYDYTHSQWLEGSVRVFDKVGQAAENVFVIPGTPSLGFDGPGCVSQHLSKGAIDQAACLAKDRLKAVDVVAKLLNEAANRFLNVNILPLNDLVCPAGNCNAVSTQGVIVFRDSQHLTDSFVKSQVPYIRARLHQLTKN